MHETHEGGAAACDHPQRSTRLCQHASAPRMGAVRTPPARIGNGPPRPRTGRHWPLLVRRLLGLRVGCARRAPEGGSGLETSVWHHDGGDTRAGAGTPVRHLTGNRAHSADRRRPRLPGRRLEGARAGRLAAGTHTRPPPHPAGDQDIPVRGACMDAVHGRGPGCGPPLLHRLSAEHSVRGRDPPHHRRVAGLRTDAGAAHRAGHR